MSHRSISFKQSYSSLFAICLISIMLSISFLRYVSYAANVDNGFAIGASYLYTGGLSDFNFNFYNNGFSTSNNYPEQIVLTATSTYSSYKVAYQIAIYIFSNTNTVLDDEAWNIGVNPPTILFHTSYQVSGLANSWHTTELKIYSSSGVYYVGYYLDGTQKDSYASGSTFDTQMVPSVVIESADTSSSDWNGHYVYGYLRNVNTQLSTLFYGGTWGYNHAGCIAQQTTTFYVGEDVQALDIIGTTGWRLDGYGGTNQLAIGNVAGYFAITHSISLNSHNNFNSNPCTVRIG